MTDNIIDLKVIKDSKTLIWVCKCGCTVHYHHANGDVQCSECDNIASISDDGWREKMPALPKEIKPADDAFKLVLLVSPEIWLKKKLKEDNINENISALVAIYKDGSASTFSSKGDFEAEDNLEWLKRQFDKAFNLIIGKGNGIS